MREEIQCLKRKLEGGEEANRSTSKKTRLERVVMKLCKQLRVQNGDHSDYDHENTQSYEDVTKTDQDIAVVHMSPLRGADAVKVTHFIDDTFATHNGKIIWPALVGATQETCKTDGIDLCVDAEPLEKFFDGRQERRMKLRRFAMSVLVERNMRLKALAIASNVVNDLLAAKSHDTGAKIHLGPHMQQVCLRGYVCRCCPHTPCSAPLSRCGGRGKQRGQGGGWRSACRRAKGERRTNKTV